LAVTVTANDIDPYALAAVTLNARANGVAVAGVDDDLLDSDGGNADLLLAGDVFYRGRLAERMLPFLERAAARGAQVLIGDPGRAFLPRDRLRVVATYQVPLADAFADAEITRVDVLQPD